MFFSFCLKWKTHHWFFTTCHSCEENQLFGWKSCQFCQLALIFLRFQFLYFKNFFPLLLQQEAISTIKLISQSHKSLFLFHRVYSAPWKCLAEQCQRSPEWIWFHPQVSSQLIFLLLPDKNMTGTLISLEPFSFL